MPSPSLLAATCVMYLLVAAPAVAAPGALDDGFGSGGALMLGVGSGGQSAANGVALAPSGALRVAGEAIDGATMQAVLLRLDANATPASAATTLTPIGAEASGAAIVTRGDGRSTVAGYGAGTSFAFARYLDDGSPDGPALQVPVGSNNDAAARAIAPYGTDQLVAAGRARDAGVTKVALVRLGGDGMLDGTFNALFAAGDGGDASADAVVAQPDGKIVAAGYALDGGVVKLALMRRLGNGTPDTEFGNPSGTVLTSIGDGGEAIANGLAILPDGTLLVAGSVRDGGVTKLLLARFTSGGAPDGGFGSGGFVLFPVGDGDDVAAAALALQPDGKIVVTGHATDSGGTNLLVARFNADGSPDGTFGTGGVTLIPLGDDGTAEANALVLEGNRAVVAGDASNGGQIQTVLAGVTLTVPAVPPPNGLPPDKTAPVLTASLTHTRFRVGAGTSAFGARKKKRAPVGTTFRYTLSEAAKVTIRIERKLSGVRRGTRCVKPAKHAHGKRCTRYVRAGQLVRASPRGSSRVPFNGRIKRRTLARGKYRALLYAVDAADNRSKTKTLNFEVVR